MTTEALYGNYELLLDKLTRYFTPSELSDLCARLDVYEGNLQVGSTQRDWAASLLRLLDETHRQMDLYLQLTEMRPTGQWPQKFASPLSQAAHIYANLPHAGRLPELTALTTPAAPHLLTRIGRESEYHAIVALLQQTAGRRPGSDHGGPLRALAARLRRTADGPTPHPGQTVFLMGRPGSGRRALLADAQKTALSLGYHVATLRFENQEEAEPRHVRVRWERIVGKQAAAYVAKAFPRTARDAGPEWAELMRQLADSGAFADVRQGSAADDPRALNALVRAAARRGPLLVCVENLDAAQSLWIDLLDDLAVHEIARELPVVLLISLDAPAPLAELRGSSHTEPTRLAQKLVRQGAADSHFLGSITPADIRAWTGPTEPRLAVQLEHLSGLDPKTVEILWLEWKAVGAVAGGAEAGGQWRIAANAQWVAGDARDHARALLDAALADARPRPGYSREQIEQILACAALEGDTFHAEAVARVLELDAAALIKFLDSLTAPTAADRPSSFLSPAGHHETARVTIDKHGQRQPTILHLYRFARPYLRLVWERYGLPPAEQAAQSRAWQKGLAEALDLFYYPSGGRIAGKLIRLFRAAGEEARAAEFHRLRAGRMTLDQERWHVDRLLEDRSLEPFATYRLFDAAFPFLNRWSRERPGEGRVGLRYCLRVGARARCLGDEEQEATSWYYAAWQRRNGGSYRSGVHSARRALATRERLLGPKHPDTASSLSVLGGLLQAQGDLAGARPCFERALATRERLLGPEHPDTAASLNNLGYLLRAQDDLAGARPCFERALAISERVLGPQHPDTATILNNLGFLLQERGDLAGAQPYLERALAINEHVLGTEHPQTAASLTSLGYLLRVQGDLSGARPLYERALAIYVRVLGPEHSKTAQSLLNLGALLVAQGQPDAARPLLEHATRVLVARLGLGHEYTLIALGHLAALPRQ